MAVLITGGHGHIGSYAARYLVAEGEDVILTVTIRRKCSGNEDIQVVCDEYADGIRRDAIVDILYRQ